MFAPVRSPRGQFVDPWRLVHMAADADPSAGEFGLLDPLLADDPELPRDGLLSQIDSEEPIPVNTTELPIPARKPLPPTARVPFALRDRGMPIPSGLKPKYRHDWHPFHLALRRAGMRSNADIDFARNIFGYEGGMEVNSENGATAGITRSTLADMDDGQGYFPAEPKQLSVQEVAEFYRRYFKDAFDDVHVTDQPLASIRDRKAAGQMIDMLFHWKYAGGKEIQRAMNEMIFGLGSDDRRRLGVREVTIDGDIGDVTYGAFNRLLDAGYGEELRNKIADRAETLARAQYSGSVPTVLQERIDQFR